MRAPRRVVLTRAARDNAQLRALLRDCGAELVDYPCIGVEPIALDPQVIARLQAGRYDTAIFVSRNGVEQLFAHGTFPSPPEVVAIGRPTAESLESAGWPVTGVPSEARASVAAKELDRLVTRRGRVLYVRGAEGQPHIREALRARGQVVDEAIVYRTVDVVQAALPLDGRPTLLLFASPSAVRHFAAHTPGGLHAPSTECLSIGLTTHAAVEALGGRGQVASEATTEALVAGAKRWLAIERETDRTTGGGRL